MPDSGDTPRYFGGRWSREGGEPREGSRLVTLVFSRFWYLILPFIGILVANARFVQPRLAEAKRTLATESRAALARQEGMRTDASATRYETIRVAAVSDTLYAPEIRAREARLDSLRQIRLLCEQAVPVAGARIDSLLAVGRGVAARTEGLAGVGRARRGELEEARARSTALRESLARGEAAIAAQAAALHRLEHPRESALAERERR
jgi:hypothetical protein